MNAAPPAPVQSPSLPVSSPDLGTVVALTELPGHPFYASWLKQAPFPVEYVSRVDLQYDFPEHTALVVTHDCYREPNVTVLRRAAEQGIPVLILPDGTLEYRNTWEKREIPPGAVFLPVLGHKIACYGRSQARALESWGNVGRCEVVGAPRYDSYAGRRRRTRGAAEPFRVLIATGMVPYYNETQHDLVRRSLLDLKDFFAATPQLNGVALEPVWRLTGELGREIGIDSAITRHSGPGLLDSLQAVDALISWPSTVMIDAMLLGLPVAVLDYCNLPHYVQPAWRITVGSQIAPTVTELMAPPPPKVLFQETMLHDSLECATPAAPRMIELAREMMRRGAEARAAGRPLDLSAPVLAGDGLPAFPPLASARLTELYPGQISFRKTDLAAMQVETEHLRRYAGELERRLIQAGRANAGTPDQGVERLHRLLPDLPRARLLAGERSQTGVWDVTLAGVTVQALHLHPPAEIALVVPTGAAGSFRTAVAIQPEAWDKPTAGGCRFQVLIDRRIVLAVEIDPARVPADRCWHEIAIEVPASASGRHEIVFATAAVRSADFGWAVWREPHFTWTGAAAAR